MIELRNDELVFRFQEVHADAELRVSFQRTLRIPDDNRSYPLPARPWVIPPETRGRLRGRGSGILA